MHNIDKEIDMTSQICVVCSYFLNNEGDLDFHVNKLIGFLVYFFFGRWHGIVSQEGPVQILQSMGFGLVI